MSNVKWMSKIQHNPPLIHMVLPASHDAGVYGDSLTRVASPKRFARTQGSNIYNQAMSGSRVFDVRVFLKRIKDESGKSVVVPTMGHFAAEKFKWPKIGKSTGAFGAYGGSFMTAVKDAVAFVKTYQSEFLILRISHTYCPEHVRAALNEFMATGDNAKYIFTRSTNIATCNLDLLRGKVIMVFASEFHQGFSPKDGYLPMYKYQSGGTIDSGLCFCGTYKSKKDMKDVLKVAQKAADEHNSHVKDHLHWVYWQQTGGNVSGNTKAKDGAHAKLGDFIKEIRTKIDRDSWTLPNVIGHDFVNELTCKQIIELNPYYGG
ncbi:MAG TPA: hypothetical protein VGE08_24955 [Steroidobacter sp.]|uniref:hypothetical protein n=1 Tax=Steroidobacter sp. TaxID=1978227 RepID=UPI002EDA0CFF